MTEDSVLAIWMVAFACLDIALLSFQTFIYAVYLPKKWQPLLLYCYGWFLNLVTVWFETGFTGLDFIWLSFGLVGMDWH